MYRGMHQKVADRGSRIASIKKIPSSGLWILISHPPSARATTTIMPHSRGQRCADHDQMRFTFDHGSVLEAKGLGRAFGDRGFEVQILEIFGVVAGQASFDEEFRALRIEHSYQTIER